MHGRIVLYDILKTKYATLMPLLILSFIAGVLTILAPCILPLLPVIVGRSITDATLSKRRVFVVILSLGLSVILFTLLLKASTLFLNVPPDFWKYLSGGIILVFGLVTLFPGLWESMSFVSKINRESNKALMSGYQRNNILGDIIVGFSLGPIFSACSPTYFVILATVLPVRPALGIFYLLTYTFGLCLALFLVSIVGQKIMYKLNIATDSRGWFKRTLGVIFILVGIGIIAGYDKELQISLLDAGFFDVTKVEQNLLNANSRSQNGETGKDAPEKNDDNFLTLSQKKQKFILAPEISSPDGFINTGGKPITIGEFRGKSVVLLDIWTYSCINCQRTIPYLNEWYKKYANQGLVIIGLSTPEFSFERILKNVEKAVDDFGIKYPVVLDNDFSTWNAYHNQFWPRKYLIDVDGYIIYDHAGEGDYAGTEHEIQRALKELGSRLHLESTVRSDIADPRDKIMVDPNKVNSPEIYFGSARNSYLKNGDTGIPGKQALTIPSDIELNNLYLGGEWNFTDEYAENSTDGSVVFKYNAKNVYVVASSEGGAQVEVYIDGKLYNTIVIKDEKLYTLSEGQDYGKRTLMLKIKDGDIKVFTFTFG